MRNDTVWALCEVCDTYDYTFEAHQNGMRNGNAVEINKDRTRFEGSYANDRRDGTFVEKDSNGKVTAKGRYVNGRRITD